jgi:hypothetical protein
MVKIELTKQECRALVQILKCTTKALEDALDSTTEWTDDERRKMNAEWFLIENITTAIGEKI